MGYPLCSSQDSDLKNFLVSPLTGPGMKMDCGEQRLDRPDRAGRYPWKFSLLLRLIFHQACGTSWSSFSANYHLVGSLKQNTNGYGFVLHQVCLIFLLFGPVLILSALYTFVTTLRQKKGRVCSGFVGKVNTH